MKNKNYSVIASVYGVEKYLDDFFISIVSQTMDFEKNIELIIIDDGSKDKSAAIIKNWQQHYPDNIKYYYKVNGGLSSARNEGLKYVTSDWVSFIDPDDFIDEHYFEIVDSFISTHNASKIGLVSCNYIYYLEDSDSLSDSHPSSFRFKQKETTKRISELDDFFQISVNSVFLRTDVIKNKALLMDERVIPNFEDGHFSARYLLAIENMDAIFLRDAKYYYRRREDSTSLLDTSWSKPEQYKDKLLYGSLNILENALNEKGEIPVYIQRIVLYDYIWFVKGIVNNKSQISFLNAKQQQDFVNLSKTIFSYIDSSVIDGFNLGGCWFYHKVGMLGTFKSESLPFQIVYIEELDSHKNLIKLRYFYHGSLPSEQITLNQEEATPAFVKTRVHDFVDEVFVNDRIIWLPFNKESKTLDVNLGILNTRLSFAGKHFFNGVPTGEIVKHFQKPKLNDQNFPFSIRFLRKLATSEVISKQYNNAWIFMDRDTQADDNAEHLYRYVVKHHPDVNAFFVVRNSSHDWQRLEKEGFRLLDFDSRANKLALLNADHLISSHADQYVVSLLDEKWFSDMLTYRYTFLQHGITQNDISNWLNNKPIDLFVTATHKEFNSIANDNNRYKYSEKEISLTGFPRHDALLKLNDRVETEKLLVIMPTWRQGIMGTTIGQGNERVLNDEFYDSDYAVKWKSFLHSSELENQVKTHGYQVVFFPHTNIQPYIEWFEVPEYINILSHDSTDSMQHLFCRASMMITDYSSVAFEMAYINKAVIYYQFDRDEVFGAGHLTDKGYFDYDRDGFGPVCSKESELIGELSAIFKNNSLPNEKYAIRINSVFAYKDGKSCQRVFECIQKLNYSSSYSD